MGGSKRVGSAHIEFSARTAKVISGMEEAKVATRKAALQMKSDIHEAQGSIAVLGEEIGVHLPRHVQRFVAAIPGIAPALSAAFSAVAIISIGKAIFEVGDKIYDTFQKAKEAQAKAAEASSAFQQQQHLSNMELAVANDRIASAIAKLERKPVNGLKMAIDEALLELEKFGREMDKTFAEMRGQIKEMQAPWYQRVTGTQGNGAVLKQADDYKAALDDINRQEERSIALARTQAEVEAVRNRAMQQRVDAAAKAKKEIGDEISLLQQLNSLKGAGADMGDATLAQNAQYQNVLIDLHQKMGPSARLDRNQASVQQGMQVLYNEIGNQEQGFSERQQNRALENRKQQDEDAKAMLSQKKQEAAEAKRAQQEADRQQMDGFRQRLEAMRARGMQSVQAEHLFWLTMQATTRRGSKNWEATQALAQAAQAEFMKSLAAQDKAMAAEKAKADAGAAKVSVMFAAENAKAAAEQISDAQKLQQIHQGTIDKLAELQIGYQRTMGTISDYVAEQRLAAIAERGNRDAMADIDAQLRRVRADGTRAVEEQRKEIAKYEQEKAALQGRIDIEKMNTRIANSEDSLLGGVQQQMAQMVAQGLDTAEQLREMFTSVIGGANEEMAKAITGQRTSWSKMAAGLANQGATKVLQTGEAGIMKLLLGHGAKGKRGESRDNPMYVSEVASAAGAAQRGAGGLLGKLMGHFGLGGAAGPAAQPAGGSQGGGAGPMGSLMSDFGLGGMQPAGGSQDGMGGLMNGMFGAVTGNSGGNWWSNLASMFVPHASGGPVSANTAYLVGEGGGHPEAFFPGVSGTMATHHALMSAVGNRGGNQVHYHIDARGTDAAQVEMRVHHAIRAAHQDAIHKAVKAVHEIHRRTAH